MLNLNQLLTIKSFFFFLIFFFLISLFLAYIANHFVNNFYLLVIMNFFIMLIIFAIIFAILKRKNKKVMYDTKKLIQYLEEVTDKNYEAVFNTKYIAEFLQIEILLKNIIKRLHKKDKKK